VARDIIGNLWVYWATGDKTDPTAPSTNEIVAGVKDTTRTNLFTRGHLRNVTSTAQQCSILTDNGWYINFTGREKALSDIVVYGGVIILLHIFLLQEAAHVSRQGHPDYTQ
jgi:hypothetical protein